MVRRSTSALFFWAGAFTQDAKPMVESRPAMLKLSLSEMGRPWRLPIGLPVRSRCWSRVRAVDIAESNKVSDKQFVYTGKQTLISVPSVYCISSYRG